MIDTGGAIADTVIQDGAGPIVPGKASTAPKRTFAGEVRRDRLADDDFVRTA